MARQKTKTPYKIAKRVLPNGKESNEYYSQVRNEFGKKKWLRLGPNYKEAEKKLKIEVAEIASKKEALKEEELFDERKKNNRQTFLDYLKENHYFEPELNIQYVFFKRTGRESYGLHHSKLVASVFHRLFDEDKANDPLGRIPYREITHNDCVELWKRLENSDIFITNGVRFRVLDILSSTYKFIQKDERDLVVNPFRTIAPFNDKAERKDREGMTVDQIKLLFADENTINEKVVQYLIRTDEEKTAEKISKIENSGKTEVDKKRLIKDLQTWKEKKRKTFESYRFTDTDYYKYFRFIMGTGLRGAECRALQYSSFVQFPYVLVDRSFKEQNSRTESIDNPKWGKKRIVFMCDSLQKMMDYAKPLKYDIYSNKHEFSAAPDAFVFSNTGGKSPLCATEIRKRWTMFVCAMGFEKHLFTPHSLRHSIAGLMMDNGIPEWFVVKWCGWETSTTNKMVLNYAKKKWNYEYPEFRELIAPVIEENFFSQQKK